ncbi:MAG: phenylacetate--CoA ligase family protein, partial [Candidatus Paceibacterales bacterium]
QVNSQEEFERIPIMEKKNYLYRYPIQQFFPKGKIAPVIYASSGSSGQPTFWFRGDDQEETGGKFHEKIFTDIFGIKKEEPTLVIICFAMGLWVAGNFTLACCRNVSRRGFNLTTITPGIEKMDVINSLQTLGPQFKNIIIAGYPPFVMDVVNDALKAKIKFTKNTFILTAGDKFSEEWRDSLLKLLGTSARKNIISIYGSADAGVLGHETPISIFIREEALKNQGLYSQLFGQEDIEPALVQYDPDYIYFEEVNKELVFTTKTSIPLVRYNIHDVGTIVPHHEMVGRLEKLDLLNKAKAYGINLWKWPFLVKKGRTDVAVTFYALNIYPENLSAGIEDRRVRKFLTGNFLAYNKDTQNHKTQKLFIKLQLNQKIKASKTIKELIKKSIVDNLTKVSIEYRKLFSSIGSRALPEIILTNHSDFGKVDAQGVMNIHGKKPKVVIGA